MDTKEPVFMPSRTSVKLANKRCAMGSSPAPQNRAEENEKQAAPKQEGKAKSREVTLRVCRGRSGGRLRKATTGEQAEPWQKESTHPRTDCKSNYESKTCLPGKSSRKGEAACPTHREQS